MRLKVQTILLTNLLCVKYNECRYMCVQRVYMNLKTLKFQTLSCDWQSGGHEFEPRTLHHIKEPSTAVFARGTAIEALFSF